MFEVYAVRRREPRAKAIRINIVCDERLASINAFFDSAV